MMEHVLNFFDVRCLKSSRKVRSGDRITEVRIITTADHCHAIGRSVNRRLEQSNPRRFQRIFRVLTDRQATILCVERQAAFALYASKVILDGI